jgi:DNA-binding transcriptional regulator YiaG
MEDRATEDQSPINWQALRARVDRARLKKERKAIRDMRQEDMGLGYLVYCARRVGRMSQAQLARRIGTSRQNISRWERNGRAPSLWKLQLIANEAGLDLVIGLRERPDEDAIERGEKDESGGEYASLIVTRR